MTGVNNSLSWAESDAIVEVVSAESCRIVLETSPPEYVKKISRYLESSSGQSGRDKVSNEPTEEDSDSGDSLFITQKPAPAPVRSIRSRHNPSSESTPVKYPEESTHDTSLSASREEPTGDKHKKRKKYKVPAHTFPFLKERRRRNRSSQTLQTIKLHNSTMGGFFKCVQEIWQGYQRGDDVAASLPTVDMDGAYISPLSEEDEEREENDDIKVVERKLFAVPLKSKSQQSWCSQLKQKKRRKATNTSQEPSQEKQLETSHKVPAKETISRIAAESSDDEATACIQAVKKTQNEPETRDGNFLNKPERLKTKRLPTPEKKTQKAREEELCDDSEARKLQKSPQRNKDKEKEVSRTVTGPQTDVFHTDNLSQTAQTHNLHSLSGRMSDSYTDSVCSKTKVKKRKRKKKEDEGQPEGAASVNVEVDVTPSLSEDNGTEPPTSQTSDENILRQEERDTPDSKQKKKSKKNKSAAKHVEDEKDGKLESDVREEDSASLACCNVEAGEEKKRKRKEDEEQTQSSTAIEPLSNDAEIPKKKKKRKKDKIINAEESEEDEGNRLEVSEETFESTFVKRKKHKKQRQSSTKDAIQDGEEGVHVSFPNDAVALAESTETISERLVNSYDPEEEEKQDDTQKTEEGLEDQNAEVVTKKKKKKKKKKKREESEICDRNISEDNGARSDDSVSVQEKEKMRTSSFLVADAESSPSIEAPVQGAESVSARDLDTESAENAGNSEERNDGVRKKKRKSKRKMRVWQDGLENDHEQEFEEPNACHSDLPQSSDHGVKRKKNTGNESELMTPEERSEIAAEAELTQANEVLVFKKKKKKKKKGKEEPRHEIQESPPAASEETESERSTLNTFNSASHKDKHSSPPLEAQGNQIFIDMTDKKKKKRVKPTDSIQLEQISPNTSTDLEPNIIPSSPMLSETSLSKSETSSSDRIMKNKHNKVKRRLHNPSEDFLLHY